MKLFHKIFLCFVVFFSVTLQIAGVLLLTHSWENALEQEKKYALSQFQYNKYILQSMLYQEPGLFFKEEGLRGKEGDFTVNCAIYNESEECLLSNISLDGEELGLEDASGQVSYKMKSEGEDYRIFLYQNLEEEDISLCFVTETDISKLVENERQLTNSFQKIYLVLLLIGLPVIFCLSSFLAKPIKRVGKAARRIAEGNYKERIPVASKDEIGELAADFNHMAAQIEEKIDELVDAARQKEDFTANFAHELKTPMTSVIGYADMLYQKELPRAQVKEAAEYILNESMRLEALSLKLMDLFVLEKQSFSMERLEAAAVFLEIEPGLRPICEKRGAELLLEAEEGTLAADYDLLKTMLLNLVDNSIKADSTKVHITGKNKGKFYEITVSDNGKGIPKEEQSRITEAFYMVDKSRARKQHGAGLGMTLIKKILEIHHGSMTIESDGAHGTSICLQIPGWEEKEGIEDA